MTTSPVINSRWTILLVLFIARTGLGYQFQTLGSVSTQLAAELSLNYTQIGTLIGLFTVAGIFLSIPVGMALRLTTERVLAALGLFLLATGGLVAAITPQLDWSAFHIISIGRLICGIGFVLSTVYLTKMITDWFAGKELATALGILMISWPMGIALAQVTQPAIADTYGWSTAFYLSSIYCLAGCALIALFYHPPDGTDSNNTTISNRLNRQQLVLTLIASSVWATFNAGYIVYLSFAQTMLVHSGMATLDAGVLVSVPSWIMIVASIGAGVLADRTGKNDLILYIGMIAATTSMLMLTTADNALTAVLLFGFIGAMPVGVIMALTAEAIPANARAFGMGVFFSFYFVIVSAAPVIAGWLYDITTNPVTPMVFAALLFAMVAVLNLVFRLVQRHH